MDTRRGVSALGMALVLAAGCLDGGAGAGPAVDAGPAGPSWSVVLEEEPGALLSVAGSAPDDVWIVGADRRDGTGPEVRHYDGEELRSLTTGDEGDLWWVALSPSGQVWMAGEGGRVLRHDPASGSFTPLPTPGGRLYGVLPFADDDVWAVGVDLEANESVVYRYDGETWAPPADLPEGVLDDLLLFKVWGPSPDEVWMVGQGGAAVRWTAGEGWARFELPRARTLFTVHGTDEVTLAVGGFVDGFLVELDPAGPDDITPEGAPELVGLYVSPDESAVAAGIGGVVYERPPGGPWSELSGAPATFLTYHGVYRDPAGGIWAVGGYLDGEPLQRGMLSYFGAGEL